MEVHAVVLNGRHAHVGTRGQAPGTLLGVLVALDLGARRHLAKAGHVGVFSLAEFLDEPDSLADLCSRSFHQRRHLSQGLAALLLLSLGQGLDLCLGRGLLPLNGGQHGRMRISKVNHPANVL